MAHKTYIPGAVDIARATHKYLTRWQSALVTGQTAGRIAALADLVQCLGVFLAAWQKPGPES